MKVSGPDFYKICEKKEFLLATINKLVYSCARLLKSI